MPSPDVIFTLKDEEVRKALAEMPKAFNSALNRAARGISGAFGRKFTRERLSILKLRRKAGKAPAGAPFLPAKMRAAGFRARLDGLGAINGKRLSIRTRSPVLVAHELGAVIRAGDGGKLRIRIARNWRQTNREERKNAFVVRRRGKAILAVKRDGKLFPIATLVSQVKVPKDLGFIDSWSAFAPEIVKRLDKAMLDTMKRLGRGGDAAAAVEGGDG